MKNKMRIEKDDLNEYLTLLKELTIN